MVLLPEETDFNWDLVDFLSSQNLFLYHHLRRHLFLYLKSRILDRDRIKNWRNFYNSRKKQNKSFSFNINSKKNKRQEEKGKKKKLVKSKVLSQGGQ